MSGDGLDIANMIAEEVGEPVSGTADHPLAAQLSTLRLRLDAAENAFDVLGLDASAETDALRSSYMSLANQLHPDKYNDAPDEMRDQATEAFDKVREAWDAVETEEKRQKYIDHVILGKPTEEKEAMVIREPFKT